MTNTHKFAPLLGKRIRVTQMTDGGEVGQHYVVTDGFITVTLAAQVEDGTEIVQRNAYNQLCINEKMNPTFKRLTVEAEFCGVNPSLLSYVTNAVEYEDYAGDVSGFVLPEGEITGAFALEVWTGLSGALNDPNANGYMLLPYVGKGNLGDIKIDGQNAITFSLAAASTRGGHSWGVGPYNVLMGLGEANEVQQLAITGAPTGGTFTLTFNGQTTAPIPYNATSAAVVSALNALNNVAPGDIVGTGGALPTTAVVLSFAGSLADENVSQITATASLTGGTSPAVAVTTTTPGTPGVAAPLPTPLDPFDHFLLIDTAVPAPIVDEQPTLVDAS